MRESVGGESKNPKGWTAWEEVLGKRGNTRLKGVEREDRNPKRGDGTKEIYIRSAEGVIIIETYRGAREEQVKEVARRFFSKMRRKYGDGLEYKGLTQVGYYGSERFKAEKSKMTGVQLRKMYEMVPRVRYKTGEGYIVVSEGQESK